MSGSAVYSVRLLRFFCCRLIDHCAASHSIIFNDMAPHYRQMGQDTFFLLIFFFEPVVLRISHMSVSICSSSDLSGTKEAA